MIEKCHAGGLRDSTTAPRNSQKHIKPTRRQGTCSRDAVMCSGVSTYASGCSRQHSGYESRSQCCALQLYYDENASCTRPKMRLEHSTSRGLVVGLHFVQMLHARCFATSRSHQHSSNPRATNATCGSILTPSILLPHSPRQLQYFR
jgi:hypothetical protein